MKQQNNKAPALTRHVDIRVDQQTYDHILHEAYQAKLNLSDYVRQCVLKHKVIVRQETIVEPTLLRQLLGELGHIGGNLNQISHHLNGGGVLSQEMVRKIQQATADLYDLKVRLDREGGRLYGNS